MWFYHSSDGELMHDASHVGTGYSGCGEGRNNVTLECKAGVGPIPRGRYRISEPYLSGWLGPICFALEPIGHDACGRSAFRIHGDTINHNASHGCIVLSHDLREKIRDSGDRELTVV